MSLFSFFARVPKADEPAHESPWIETVPDGKKSCDKCGQRFFFRIWNRVDLYTFSPPPRRILPEGPKYDHQADVLVYTCPTCGWEWNEPCKDAKPAH